MMGVSPIYVKRGGSFGGQYLPNITSFSSFCFIWSTISQSNIKAKWKRGRVGSVCCGVGRIEIHLKTWRSGIERAAATMKRRTSPSSSAQPAVKSLCRQLAMRLVFSLGTFFHSQLRNKRRRDSFGGTHTRELCTE